MYDSIRIQNFRGIQDLTISNLGRINLLVGANNVGKTSVLEALNLLLLGNDPLDFITLASRRRDWPFGVPVRLLDRLSYGQKWSRPVVVRGLLHSEAADSLPRATDEVIVSSRDPNGNEILQRLQTRQISVVVDGMMTGDGVVIVHGAENAMDATAESIRSVDEFRYQTTVDPVTGAATAPWPQSPFGGCITHWTWVQSSEETLAENLGAAYESRDDAELVDALRRFDPRIERLFVSTQDYAIGERQMRVPRPVVKAHVSGVATAIPISLLGSGADRLLDLLLAFPSAQRWLVLIDELESGIYYENLPVLWKVLRGQTKVPEAQLFATTHSLECVDSVLTAFEQDDEAKCGFRLHRLERSDAGLSCTTYTYADLEETRALNWEFR